MKVNKQLWPTWSSSVASPASPLEYNEASCDRLMKRIDHLVVRVKGVRPQFEAINKTELIYFKTDEEKKYYDDTEARYHRERAKLMERVASGEEMNPNILELVLLMKRCMAAEYCRRYHIVDRMLEDMNSGYAAVAAVKFKPTIIACVRILCEERGISRDKISLIWGGGQTALTGKQKAKAQIKEKAEKLRELGMDEEDILETLDLSDVEDRKIEELPEYLRLGPQDKEERQREIDRFQSGKTQLCFFTFKAGGVGLSLHHTDELSKVKVKRKPNGYALESDIPNVPIRPRKVIVAPTYSAIELVQGLGRCPRLTSLSPTEQTLLFYGNTVEVDVAHIVSQKLRCLSRVVRMKESWQDVVQGGVSKDVHLEDESKLPDKDDGEELMGGGSEVEE